MNQVSLLRSFIPRTFLPLQEISSMTDRFKGLPHKEAAERGKILATDSTKEVRSVEMAGEIVVVKSWNGLAPETRQSAVNELVGRLFCKHLKKVFQGIKGLGEHASLINIPSAIAYETGGNTDGKIVLVTEFIDGAEHLNPTIARKLSTELRAIGGLIPLLAGAHQFPTSSFLCNNTTEGRIEVTLIDLESIHNTKQMEPDYATQLLFYLLQGVSGENGTIEEFNRILSECGNSWYEIISSEENRGRITDLIKETIGEVEIVSTPEEMAQHLLKVAEYHRQRGFTLGERAKIEQKPLLTEEQNSPLEDTPQFVINEELSLSRCGDDASLLKELILMFQKEYPGWLKSLKEAVESQDLKEVRRSAHTLKGAVSIFSNQGEPPFDATFAIEQMGAANDLTNAQSAYEELERAMRELLIPALRALYTKHNPAL